MTQTAILAALLAAIFSLFLPGVQRTLQAALKRGPGLAFAAPALLTCYFAAASAAVGVVSGALMFLVAIYTTAPALLCYFEGARTDFLVILLLGLPMEFATGAALIPRAQQSFLHSVAYGIAILLGLTLFLGLRRIEGMKYNAPRG